MFPPSTGIYICSLCLDYCCPYHVINDSHSHATITHSNSFSQLTFIAPLIECTKSLETQTLQLNWGFQSYSNECRARCADGLSLSVNGRHQCCARRLTGIKYYECIHMYVHVIMYYISFPNVPCYVPLCYMI